MSLGEAAQSNARPKRFAGKQSPPQRKKHWHRFLQPAGVMKLINKASFGIQVQNISLNLRGTAKPARFQSGSANILFVALPTCSGKFTALFRNAGTDHSLAPSKTLKGKSPSRIFVLVLASLHKKCITPCTLLRYGFALAANELPIGKFLIRRVKSMRSIGTPLHLPLSPSLLISGLDKFGFFVIMLKKEVLVWLLSITV